MEWCISVRERGTNVFQSELLVQAYEQSHGWNVRRQGEQPKEEESVGEQEEFPQNSCCYSDTAQLSNCRICLPPLQATQSKITDVEKNLSLFLIWVDMLFR